MVKELEKVGIPVAQITNLVPVAKNTGSNRIVPGIAITNPCSDVNLPIEDQKKMRKNFMKKALAAVAADIKEQTVF